MTCEELRACLDVYLDRELDVARSLDARAHLADCVDCQWAYAREGEFRALLKARLPQVAAPPELHARIRASLTAAERPSAWARVPRALRWVSLPVAALALLALTFGLRAWMAPGPTPIVSELVSQHQVYSRMATPAEIASADQAAVAGWLNQRVRFEVPVPDFSPAGIRLIGARLSSLSDREVAYLLYEKQGTRVSLFAFPGHGVPLPAAGWIEVGDSRFYVGTVKGLEVVLWTQGNLTYGLISPLGREALLECALSVWRLVTTPARPGA